MMAAMMSINHVFEVDQVPIIDAVGAGAPPEGAVIDLGDAVLVPGFVDASHVGKGDARLERGAFEPRGRTFAALVDALGLSPLDLYTEDVAA